MAVSAAINPPATPVAIRFFATLLTAKGRRRANARGELSNQEAGGRLAPNTVRHRSSHTVQAIEKLAMVVLAVPEINGCENDQKSDKNSHLIFPSPSAHLQLFQPDFS